MKADILIRLKKAMQWYVKDVYNRVMTGTFYNKTFLISISLSIYISSNYFNTYKYRSIKLKLLNKLNVAP